MKNWWRGHPREANQSVLPRSLMHVLRSDEELRAALERAIEFERATASRSNELVSRYQAMLPHGVTVAMPASLRDSHDESQPERRSA
jgi:hypothetical protein